MVAIILMKTLKRDFTRYSANEAEELESMDGGGHDTAAPALRRIAWCRAVSWDILTHCLVLACDVLCSGVRCHCEVP